MACLLVIQIDIQAVLCEIPRGHKSTFKSTVFLTYVFRLSLFFRIVQRLLTLDFDHPKIESLLMQQCSETFSDVDNPKIDSLSKKCNNLHFWSKAPTYTDKQKVICFDMQIYLDFWLFVKYGWFSFFKFKYKVLNKIICFQTWLVCPLSTYSNF